MRLSLGPILGELCMVFLFKTQRGGGRGRGDLLFLNKHWNTQSYITEFNWMSLLTLVCH